MCRGWTPLASAFALVILLATAPAAAIVFQPFTPDVGVIHGMSGDGSTVVFGTGNPEGSGEKSIWTANAGFTAIPGIHQSSYPSASPFPSYPIWVYGLSYDGSQLVGRVSVYRDAALEPDAHGFSWQNGIFRDLGLAGLIGGAYAVSDDGAVIVGQSGMAPGLWTADGFVKLSTDGHSGVAWDVSANGEIIVGTMDYTRPVYWQLSRGIKQAGLQLDMPAQSRVYRLYVAADGGAIAGTLELQPSGVRAYLWLDPAGAPQYLGDFKIQGLSDGGTVVVGEANGKAVLWDRKHGLQRFYDWLVDACDLGTTLHGWDFTSVKAVSDDGLVFVGTGNLGPWYADARACRVKPPKPEKRQKRT